MKLTDLVPPPVIVLFLISGALAFAQTHQSWIRDSDRVLLIKGKVAGEIKNWLSIESHNGSEWEENGFDPSYTRVVSDYKPMFRHLPNGQWEIMYTSEIAEKLP